jgi:predicted phosphodiesterase
MLLVLGDIHGNFKFVKHAVKSRHLSGCSIIQVGDFGIGYEPTRDEDYLQDLNSFLKESNVTLYVIRGNHDDPAFFKGDYLMSNLKLLPDYSQLKIGNHNILFVGGAISVDRKFNLQKMQISASFGHHQPLYWYDEKFVLDKQILETITGVDMLITHTSPKWCYPDNSNGFGHFVEQFAADDSELLSDLREERELMTEMFTILMKKNAIKKHFYGHFHNRSVQTFQGIEHHLLNINELKVVDKLTEEDYSTIF